MAAPKKIFLQTHLGIDEATWHWERVDLNDVEYIRADLVEQLREEARESALNGDYQLPESKL